MLMGPTTNRMIEGMDILAQITQTNPRLKSRKRTSETSRITKSKNRIIIVIHLR